MDEIMREVAKKIEEIIKKQRVNKIAVAKYCGHTAGWLNNILNEGKDIKIVDLLKIAEYLKTDITELLPVPQKLDIENMTLIDLIRHIAHNECVRYMKENGCDFSCRQK